MVSDWAVGNLGLQQTKECSFMHYDAQFRWLDRTCLCSKSSSTATKEPGNFTQLNNVSEGSQYMAHSLILLGSQVTVWTRSNHTP
jgi:hypothetical protein